MKLVSCGTTISSRRDFDEFHGLDEMGTLLQAAQKGRSARPQRVKARGGTDRTLCGPFALAMYLGERKSPPVFPTSEILIWYVEGLNAARTMVTDFFSSLREADL